MVLFTTGNEDLLISKKIEADEISNELEYRLSHIMSDPMEPNTVPRLIDLENDPDGILHDC